MSYFERPAEELIIVSIFFLMSTVLLVFLSAVLTGRIAKRMKPDVHMVIPVALSSAVIGFLILGNVVGLNRVDFDLSLQSDPRGPLVILLVAHLIVWWRFNAWNLREGFSLKRILPRGPSET